ncbi:MAG TPA: AmmeMemoRadiSam system protein B, partial [Candidatus Limnocylindrales bacterium]|nr:AmmeMemoRadiSam system protein B [Candidatus Limnocylindrales bacterium]
MTAAPLATPRPRHAAHAGSFYPADPTRLVRQVDALLAEARGVSLASPALPLGLLVPHAGIDWSGAVAARAWIELEPHPVDRGLAPTIILLGTNHFDRRSGGASVWSGGSWLTPIGEVAVDDALRERVLGLGPPFVARSEPHVDEHSIEVQLPFLVRLRADARLLPLLVGPLDEDDAQAGGSALGRLLATVRAAGHPVVLAASSDLAHYPSQSVAEDVDAESLRSIAALDADRLIRHEQAAETTAIRGLDCALCGIEPVCLGIAAFTAMGATAGTVLAHATSADAGGATHRVVG